MAYTQKTAFDKITECSHRDQAGDHYCMSESWYQGRGMFGGIINAIFTESFSRKLLCEDRHLRTLNVHFTAPAQAGKCVVAVKQKQQGTRVSQLSAELEQGGRTMAFASATYTATRETGIVYEKRAVPKIPNYRFVPEIPRPPEIPVFTTFFEYRVSHGAVPFSASNDTKVEGWIRPKQAQKLDDKLLVALVDAWLPAVLGALDGQARPAVSVDLSVQVYHNLKTLSLPEDSFYFFRINSSWSADGYAEELIHMWTEKGVLLAECRQLVALL